MRLGMLTSDGGITGNPADFIIDAEGRIVFALSRRCAPGADRNRPNFQCSNQLEPTNQQKETFHGTTD